MINKKKNLKLKLKLKLKTPRKNPLKNNNKLMSKIRINNNKRENRKKKTIDINFTLLLFKIIQHFKYKIYYFFELFMRIFSQLIIVIKIL